MRKGGKSILKSLFALSPLCDALQLSKISGEESNDLIGLPIVERTGYNAWVVKSGIKIVSFV